MATSLRRFNRLVPAYRTRHGPEADALVLATGLLVGLLGLVPAFTLAVGYFAVPIPLPSLVATGVVLVAYAIVTLVLRRVRVGTLVGVVVLGTIAANVPFSSVEYPGDLGPSIWLFEVPLAVGLAIAVRDGWHRDLLARRDDRTGVSLPHVLFGAFVCWSMLAGVFGAGPSLAAGLFFALHVFTAFAVFVFVAGAVARGWLQFRTVLATLVAATISHLAFGVAQLVHGRNFGLSYIGEVTTNARPLVEVFGVTFHAGPFVAGLTGNPSPFSAFALLVTPVLALHAIGSRSAPWTRVASGTLAVGALVLVRLTLKDAARGSAAIVLVGIAVAAVGLALWNRGGNDGRLRTWRTRLRDARWTVASAFGVVLAGTATLVAPVRILTGPGARDWASAGPSGIAAAGGSGAAGSAGSATTGPTTTSASESVMTALSKVSGIDPASPSVRFRVSQYVGAFDAGLDYPLFGLRGANFAYVAGRYGMGRSSDPGIEIGNAVHSVYLSVLTGTGIPGLFLFCGLLVSVLWAAVGLVRESREERWLACATVISVVGYVAFVFWNVMLVTVVGTITFFALAGAIVGARSRIETSGYTPVRSSVSMTDGGRERLGGWR